jgi:hypothetical protein
MSSKYELNIESKVFGTISYEVGITGIKTKKNKLRGP